MTATAFFDKYLDADPETKKEMVRERELFAFWQGLLRVVGSFGDCPRCHAVCPVGNDYHAYLAPVQKVIPEKTPEKTHKAAAFKAARKEDAEIAGLAEGRDRWVGPEGYQGIVARQLQDFKRLQKARAEEEGH